MKTQSPLTRVLAALASPRLLLALSTALVACGHASGDPDVAEKLSVMPPSVPRLRTAPQPLVPPSTVDVDRPRTSALLPFGGAAAVGSPIVTSPGSTLSLDARVLVISADGQEPALEAITSLLDYLGTPYTVMVATQDVSGLTAADLRTATRGFYSGVILTSGTLPVQDGTGAWVSALDAGEWAELYNYEETFGVRQVTWYTWPDATHGFLGTVTSACYGPEYGCSATPITGTLTSDGQAVFTHVNAAHPIVVRGAYTYFADADTSTGTVPLLLDGSGKALIALRTYANGRQNLAMTFDSNPYLVHTLQLGYDVIAWLTRGLFLGEHRAYLAAQVDDHLIENDLWPYPEDSGHWYRCDGNDLYAFHTWQQALRTHPLATTFRTDLAFNGEGSTTVPANDPLVLATRALNKQFKWINHTFTHRNLDATSSKVTRRELSRNNTLALEWALFPFTVKNLVTPDVSGLANASAMEGAWLAGVRYVVSDASRPSGDNPSPNAGRYNALQPKILEVPRYPTNLFYNVSVPAQWVGEYNDFHRSYWGRDLTYLEVLDVEADWLVRYLLSGDLNPLMFHQANMRAYDGTHSLLGDLIDRAVTEFAALQNFPILSPSLDELGVRMARRMAYDSSGAELTIGPGKLLTVTVTNTAVVPITGAGGAGSESYAGQSIRYVTVPAGQSVTLQLP